MAVESFRVEGESVFFKDVTPGRTTTLQLSATHTPMRMRTAQTGLSEL